MFDNFDGDLLLCATGTSDVVRESAQLNFVQFNNYFNLVNVKICKNETIRIKFKKNKKQTTKILRISRATSVFF